MVNVLVIVKKLEEMYRYIGKLMKQHPFLSTYILTSNKEFEYLVDRKATKRRKLFNGYIECTYYQYWGKRQNVKLSKTKVFLMRD